MTMITYPSSDDSYGLLHRSGWPIGDVAYLDGGQLVWMVSGSNGGNLIRAEGATKAAWYRACDQARAVGMLDRGAGAAPIRSDTRG